jgi:hypothetical protein
VEGFVSMGIRDSNRIKGSVIDLRLPRSQLGKRNSKEEVVTDWRKWHTPLTGCEKPLTIRFLRDLGCTTQTSIVCTFRAFAPPGAMKAVAGAALLKVNVLSETPYALQLDLLPGNSNRHRLLCMQTSSLGLEGFVEESRKMAVYSGPDSGPK